MRTYRGRRLVVRCLALLLLAPARVMGSPVTYQESVSGDLGASLPMVSPLAFDTGINSVSGNTFDNALENPAFVDFDSFAFSVPSGAQLTSIGLAFTTTVQPGTIQATLQYILAAGNLQVFSVPPGLDLRTFDLLAGSPGSIFSGVLPTGPGVYGVNWSGASIAGIGRPAFSSDYTWTFTVEASPSAVPEPASLVLLGSGIAVLVRRPKRAS